MEKACGDESDSDSSLDIEKWKKLLNQLTGGRVFVKFSTFWQCEYVCCAKVFVLAEMFYILSCHIHKLHFN